jgi:methylase of polypeptide subunit release factors
MLIEIGAWQGQAARTLAERAFPGAQVAVHRDLAGHERVLEVTTGAERAPFHRRRPGETLGSARR